jgi:hypothetical protein
MDVPPFPFVIACGRSGTTLLRAMLERHPSMAIPPESYFPLSLYERYGRSAPVDVAALATDLAANVRYRDWGLDAAATRAALDGAPTYPAAIRALYGAYAAARGKDRYGDKTPPFVLHMDLLAGVFPESRFVHLIRDGRDVSMSLVETEFGPRRITRAADVWRRRVERGMASGRALGPQRYLEIRYESLVADPAATLADVCRFIELERVDDMLRPEAATDTAIPERERAHHGNLAKPITAGLRDWRHDLAARDVAAVEAVAGDLLSRLGYERAYPRLPAAARVRASVGRARSEATRRLRRGARTVRGGRA